MYSWFVKFVKLGCGARIKRDESEGIPFDTSALAVVSRELPKPEISGECVSEVRIKRDESEGIPFDTSALAVVSRELPKPEISGECVSEVRIKRDESEGIPFDTSALAVVSRELPKPEISGECVTEVRIKRDESEGIPFDTSALAVVSRELPKPEISRECVRDALALLIRSHLLLRLPQPCPDVAMWAIPQIFCNTGLKFRKPSTWGILRDYRHYAGAIEDLCHEVTGAGTADKFILRVYIPHLHTSLHCVAVRDRQIYDPACPELGWLPLTPASFACLGITEISAGFKITGG
jgi:hypothetical protein